MPLAATRIYEMSFFTGFGVSALVYYALNVACPVRGAGECTRFKEVDVSLGQGVAGAEVGQGRGSEEFESDKKSAVSEGVQSVRSRA